MVSTAIGGIIIGMILTGTNAAKSKAREVQCMNNMRTWGQLMSSFAGDNRQQLWVSDTHTATDASGNLLNMQPWNSGAESPYGIYLNATSTVTSNCKLRMCPGAVNLGYAVTAYLAHSASRHAGSVLGSTAQCRQAVPVFHTVRHHLERAWAL